MSSASELIEEPRSWREMLVDTMTEHSSLLYLSGVALFGFCSAVAISIVLHINFFEVGWVARVEAENQMSFAQEVFMTGLYLNLTVYLLAFGACIWGVFDSR